MTSTKIYSNIGRIARLYDVLLMWSGYKKSVSYFVSQLPFSSDKKINVLDAGCGTGMYTLAILEKYPNAYITAFDLNPILAGRLQEKVDAGPFSERAHILARDIEQVDKFAQENRYNLIIIAGVLEYVNLNSVITKLAGLLKEGGYILSSPVRDSLYGKLVAWLYRCRPYSRAAILQSFTSQKLTLVRSFRMPWYNIASFKDGDVWKAH